MPDAGCSASQKPLAEPDLFDAPRSQLFFDRLLQDLDAQHRIGIHLLELRVFLLQRFQALGIRLIHLPIFLPPAMEGGDRDLLLTAERFLVQIAAIAFAEQPDYLFWLVSLLLHFEDLGYSNPLTRFGPVF